MIKRKMKEKNDGIFYLDINGVRFIPYKSNEYKKLLKEGKIKK